MTDLTNDGTITDLPSNLRDCPTTGCGAELFVEAVVHDRHKDGQKIYGTVYTLRCKNGHEWEWVKGATELRPPTDD